MAISKAVQDWEKVKGLTLLGPQRSANQVYSDQELKHPSKHLPRTGRSYPQEKSEFCNKTQQGLNGEMNHCEGKAPNKSLIEPDYLYIKWIHHSTFICKKHMLPALPLKIWLNLSFPS